MRLTRGDEGKFKYALSCTAAAHPSCLTTSKEGDREAEIVGEVCFLTDIYDIDLVIFDLCPGVLYCLHLISAIPSSRLSSSVVQPLTPKKERISCSALLLGPQTSDKSRPSFGGAAGIKLLLGRSLFRMVMMSVQLNGPANANSRADWTLGSRRAATWTLAMSRTSTYHSSGRS